MAVLKLAMTGLAWEDMQCWELLFSHLSCSTGISGWMQGREKVTLSMTFGDASIIVEGVHEKAPH